MTAPSTPPAPPAYPFTALVGQPLLQRALLLAAIDPAIGGVLISGPRGTAKSTAARALAALLPQAPFVTLPLAASLEQLVGALDVEDALRENTLRLRPGLLARADGGVLYVDEVNLLPDALVDALLDAAASGVHTVERDGLSQQHASRFVLVGTMNPEEGELRPQLLDRFGLMVALANPPDAAARQAIVRARLAFDADPAAFAAAQQAAVQTLATALATARARLCGWQRETGAGCKLERPDRHIALGLRTPGIGRRRQRRGHTGDGAGNHAQAHAIGFHARDLRPPEHGEVRRGHLVALGQVEPDLEQLAGVGRILVQQRKHFSVHDAAPGGQPLHVALAEAGRRAQRIRVVDQAAAGDGDGLEAAVRVGRKTGHLLTVVHAPTVFLRKVLADLAARQRSGGPQLCVACGVVVVVVHTEQKGVQRRPLETKGLGAEDGGCVAHVACSKV